MAGKRPGQSRDFAMVARSRFFLSFAIMKNLQQRSVQ
jgi:hypothetical protein